MKIYYIKNGKCVDVIDKLKVTNKAMAYAVPALMTGERLIDYHLRMSHGNVPEATTKLVIEYVKFTGDVFFISYNTTIGRLVDFIHFDYLSNTMNLLVGM